MAAPRTPSARPRDTEVVILSGVRTGVGAVGGSLKEHSAPDLAVMLASMERFAHDVRPKVRR